MAQVSHLYMTTGKIYTSSSFSEGSFPDCFPSHCGLSPWTSSNSLKHLHLYKHILHSMPSTPTIKTWKGLVSCCTNKSPAVHESARWGLLAAIFLQPISSHTIQSDTLLPKRIWWHPCSKSFRRLSPSSSAGHTSPSPHNLASRPYLQQLLSSLDAN